MKYSKCVVECKKLYILEKFIKGIARYFFCYLNPVIKGRLKVIENHMGAAEAAP